jgi:hypothetical protein
MTTNKDRTQQDQRSQLLRGGYAVSAAGVIECHRAVNGDTASGNVLARWRHTHLASIRLTVDTKTAAALISAVFAAVSEEPGEILVGTSKTDVLLLFKLGSTYNVEVRDGWNTVQPFVYQDAGGLFFATADAKVTTVGYTTVDTAFNVGDYVWRADRSPLNTRLNDLAPLYPDISQRAYDAVGAFLRENGGRWGPLAIPKNRLELLIEQSRAERAARAAAGIVEEEDTPESADAKLVAAHPDLRATDGPIGVLVHEARRRVDARKEAARLEKKRLAQEEKDAIKRVKDMAAHVSASA